MSVPRDAGPASAAAFAAAPAGDPRTSASRLARAERDADRAAWRLLPLQIIASVTCALVVLLAFPPGGVTPWVGAVFAVAALAWWRRDPDCTAATRMRLALAWALCGASLALLPGAASTASLPVALCALLVAGALPLRSRPALVTIHAAATAVPGIFVLGVGARVPESLLVALVAMLTTAAAFHCRREQVAAALADMARDEAEGVATTLGKALAESTAACDRLLDDEDCLVVVVDARGRIERLNRPAREQIGAVPGERFRDAVPLVEPRSRRRARDAAAECQRDGVDVRVEHAVLLVPGVAREFEVSVRARPLGGGRVLVTLRDDSEMRTLQRLQLLREGRDPVTGLLNRRELEQRFHRLRGGPETSHSLCCIEVEQVDLVNEACGYPAGDALLHQVALQMAATARAEDCLARLGGGQFALLLPDCDAATARSVAAKLLASVSATPFPWRDQRFALSGRAGITSFKGTLVPLPEVLSEAVAACHAARDGDGIHAFAASDAVLARHAELRDWMQRVQRAIEHGSFELLAHDIVPVAGSRADQRHAELLVRMRGADGDLVAPGLFLGAAERLGLMPALDRWVIRNAFAAIARADGPLAAFGFCAINLSGQSLSQRDLQAYVEQQADATGVDPARVCFEITETAVIADLDAAEQLMNALRARGFRFSLDDFGSGLSSYAYLKRLPADLLKIDGAFVRGLVADTTDRAVVESINQVAHRVGMRTIAEYVQNVATLAALERLGVDYAQGSLFGEPRRIA